MVLIINDRIRNREVRFFNNFTVTLRFDSVASAFDFTFLYDPKNPEHVELAVIGHYHIARVEHEGTLLMTGYMLSPVFTDKSKKQPVTISGYSLPGVLEDCNIPVELYPLQYDGLTLREITRKLISLFDFDFVVHPSVSARMDQVFPVTKASATQSIKDYLADLASQKNIVLSHTPEGNLLFTQAMPNKKPILNFDGGIPFSQMRLSFKGQAMHSHITVMKQANSDGGNAGQATIRNPYVRYVYRPVTIIQDSGDDNSTMEAAKMALANELKNFNLMIDSDRWLVSSSEVVTPNNTLSAINPEVALIKKSDWFIEQVKLTNDEKKTVATLTCVLPEVYNGNVPVYLYEGINLH